LKRLVVTADDFGAAPEVNEAVERAYREGALTAASLMVAGAAAADAVARAKAMPGLRVGLHLVLVGERPALPSSAIPDLVDGRGRLRADMARAGAAMAFRPRVRRQLEAEIRAQFEAFRATGLVLDHVNAHKHFHLHPTICSLMISVGREFGMRAARAPCEPRLPQEAAAPRTRMESAIARPFALALRRRLRAKGILVPDAVFGLAWSGAMTAPRLRAILKALPEGLSEIYMHPATGPYEGSAPGYRYAEELMALTDPSVLELVNGAEARRGGFADFAPSPSKARLALPSGAAL
jgi:hopanoid biosynthesis associated protein HpnK